MCLYVKLPCEREVNVQVQLSHHINNNREQLFLSLVINNDHADGFRNLGRVHSSAVRVRHRA